MKKSLILLCLALTACFSTPLTLIPTPTPKPSVPLDVENMKPEMKKLFQDIVFDSKAPFKPERKGAKQCTKESIVGHWKQDYFKPENKDKVATWNFSAVGDAICTGECVPHTIGGLPKMYLIRDVKFADTNNGEPIPGIHIIHDRMRMMASCEIVGNTLYVGDPGGKSGGIKFTRKK